MKKINYIVTVVVLCLFMTGNICFGSDWKDVLDDVHKKYKDFEKKVKDITMVQDNDMIVPQGKMTSEMTIQKKGEKIRIDTTMKMPGMDANAEGMNTVVITDGKDTWIISSFMGKQKLSNEQSMQYQTEKDWWHLISEKGKIIAEESVEGRNCHLIEFEKDSGSIFSRLWLDKEELILVKGEIDIENMGKIMWIHSDFREILNKWQYPYKTLMYNEGKLFSTSIVKSIEINKGLDNSLFDPDKVPLDKQGMNNKMFEMLMEGQKEAEQKEEE